MTKYINDENNVKNNHLESIFKFKFHHVNPFDSVGYDPFFPGFGAKIKSPSKLKSPTRIKSSPVKKSHAIVNLQKSEQVTHFSDQPRQ